MSRGSTTCCSASMVARYAVQGIARQVSPSPYRTHHFDSCQQRPRQLALRPQATAVVAAQHYRRIRRRVLSWDGTLRRRHSVRGQMVKAQHFENHGVLGKQGQRAPGLADSARGSGHRTCPRTVQEGDLPQIYDDIGLSATTGGGKDGVSVDGGGDVQFTGSSHHGGTRSDKDGADGWHFDSSLKALLSMGFRASNAPGGRHGQVTGHGRNIDVSGGQSADGLQNNARAEQMTEAAQRRPDSGDHHKSCTASFRWGSIRPFLTAPTCRQSRRQQDPTTKPLDAVLDQRLTHHLTGCLSTQHAARTALPTVLGSTRTHVPTSRTPYGCRINEHVHTRNTATPRSSQPAPISPPSQRHQPCDTDRSRSLPLVTICG